ncbi:MAG: hypothetical protein K8R85_12315, partial [Bacteroidetes bacterium]|nr:hypothetical protein [Bacteroidota bacterium]
LTALLMQKNALTMALAGIVCILAVVIMNNKYFTIKFYENNIYLQRGFIASFANKFIISYRSLIKMEIYEGNFDTSGGTVFQLKYYNGNKFLKKTVYCSAINVPCEKIVTLLQTKRVRVLFPN